MGFRNAAILLFFFSLIGEALFALSMAEQFKEVGYLEISDKERGKTTYESLYADFDALIEFLETNPLCAKKLFIAKEQFIRTKARNYYSTDIFGFFDESEREGRRQISFYYSTHFHRFICSCYPELNAISVIRRFLEACLEVQNPCKDLFFAAAVELGVEAIFSSEYGYPPVLFKVVKYLPSYSAKTPHYDGSLFSLFLDSTDNEALLLSPYKSSFNVEDFKSPVKDFLRGDDQSSNILIPGALLAEFSIYPTPHIVAERGRVRYAAIAFAMKPNATPRIIELTPLPIFKH